MRMYLAGEWSERPEEDEIRSPYDGQLVDRVPSATLVDVETALAAAVEGARRQQRLSAFERTEVLRRAADIAEERVADLARTICLETGKVLSEATSEAERAAPMLRLAAHEGSQLYGHSLPLDAHPGAGRTRTGYTVRQPCGVVVAITPFNYPLLLVLHKVAPALAAGNSVVLKPARQTPLVALKLIKILLEAGLDPLAISCVTGPGRELGDALVRDSRVRKISFTGSTQTGDAIARAAGVKKLSLELGASCPLVILPDADVELAAEAVASTGYVNAGQACISVQRVVVDAALQADFLDALLPKVQHIRTGDPLAASTTMGTLISAGEAERVHRTLKRSEESGAAIVTGGDRDGAIVEPAVVVDVPPDAPLSQEELFGPAVAITPVSGVDEAIAVANDTRYGLSAGIFTRDVDHAMRFAREVESGMVHINWSPLWRADLMPYGGMKDSGIGREGIRWAIEEMTEVKTVVLHAKA